MRDTREPPFEPDPVIDAYKPGIDVTLLIANLRRTHEERFRMLESMGRLVESAHRARGESFDGGGNPPGRPRDGLCRHRAAGGAEALPTAPPDR